MVRATFQIPITVVSIASVQGYWGLKMNEPTSSGYPWLRMYQGYTWKGGISLDVLANVLLPMAEGMPPWDALREFSLAETKAPRAAEAFLGSWTPQGLAMSPDPGEVWLVGDFQTVFNDAAKNATKARMDHYVTGLIPPRTTTSRAGSRRWWISSCTTWAAVRSASAATAPTARSSSATGGEDPRKALRQFAGTDAGALNLSKFLNQLLPKAMVDKGARVAFANANGEQLAPGAAGVLPGNAKDQFFSVQRKADSFVIDYETEQALKSFNKGATDALVLDGKTSWLKGSMQISISAGNLEAGKLTSYTFTKPPQITMHTEVTTDSLYKQVAGTGF